MDIEKTGALIAAARREQGLTQKALAGQLHVSDRAVSKWERGLNLPEASLFEPLCQILDITVVELLRGERTQATVPDLEQAVDTAVGLAGTREKQKKRYWRTILVLLILLAAAAVYIVRPMWEDRQRQRYLDRDNVRPNVYLYQVRYPSTHITMQAGAVGFYGPFEADGALLRSDLAVSRPWGSPSFLQEVELGPAAVRFYLSFEKSDMEMKVLRWPDSLRGTDAGLEDGEEVPFSYVYEGEEGPVYDIQDLGPNYLYAIVIFWGNGYYAEYPFHTSLKGGD